MGNISEARIRQAVVLSRAAEGVGTPEAPVFTTAIYSGEGIIIDNRFLIGYKKVSSFNKDGILRSRRGKIALLRDRKDSLLVGNDEAIQPRFSANAYASTRLGPLYFNLPPEGLIIIVGERKLHVREILTPERDAFKIDSPAEFSFEKINSGTSLLRMQEIFAQKFLRAQGKK
jgi:hypothetical protein